MSDEDDISALAKKCFELWGNTVALELMLRGLYAKWALEKDDPLAWLKATHSGMIQSMVKVARLDDVAEAKVIEYAETHLDWIFGNIETRIRGELSARE